MVDAYPTEFISGIVEKVPFPKRLGRPEEFSNLIISIIENEMLNGTTIRIDGALRLG